MSVRRARRSTAATKTGLASDHMVSNINQQSDQCPVSDEHCAPGRFGRDRPARRQGRGRRSSVCVGTLGRVRILPRLLVRTASSSKTPGRSGRRADDRSFVARRGPGSFGLRACRIRPLTGQAHVERLRCSALTFARRRDRSAAGSRSRLDDGPMLVCSPPSGTPATVVARQVAGISVRKSRQRLGWDSAICRSAASDVGFDSQRWIDCRRRQTAWTRRGPSPLRAAPRAPSDPMAATCR